MRTAIRVMSALSMAALAVAPVPALAADDVSIEAAFDTATWFFQCPTDRVQLPDPSPTSLIMEGAGPHYNLRGKLLGTPLTIKGKICPPASQMRDIVLAIDVSGSMVTNDPRAAGSCGRLEALNTVLDSLPANIANVALVTFSDGIMVYSSRLQPDKTTLLAEITNNGRIPLASIACAADGGTYYKLPLTKAETLLTTGRKGATKELFFVSDGVPTDGAVAAPVAANLKTNGVIIDGQQHLVTIGTIMLGSEDDTYLRTEIASVDAAGAPLHAVVADADDLAQTLGRMSSAQLIGATVAHGPDNVPTRSPIDIMPYVQADYSFEVPAFMLNIDGRQSFYDVVFEYWDTNHNRQTVGGRIHWLD